MPRLARVPPLVRQGMNTNPRTDRGPCTRCGLPITGLAFQATVQGGARVLTVATTKSRARYHRDCGEQRIGELREAELAQYGVAR